MMSGAGARGGADFSAAKCVASGVAGSEVRIVGWQSNLPRNDANFGFETVPIMRRTAMADKSNDPVVLWQNMIGELEKGFNAFANEAMASPQFSKLINQVGGTTAGAQSQLRELMEKYLISMNLPIRAQMVSMAERLQSIEAQLNEIKAMLHQVHGNTAALNPASPATRRPPRTKRPPQPAEAEQKG